MADVLLAGVLGAAVLAIILLYRSHRRHETIITQLRAEVAAEKIARLAFQASASAPPEPDDVQPVRSKGHLSLYIGGGVVAVATALRGWCRTAWHQHRAIAVSATASVVAVAGTTAALVIASSNDTTHAPDGFSSTPPAAAAEADRAPHAPDDVPAGYDEVAAVPVREDETGTGRPPPAPSTSSNDAPPPPSSEDQESTPPGTPADRSPAAPSQPSGPAQVPPASSPAPQQQAPAPSTDDEGRGGICVTADPLLDLCLLGRR